MGRMESGFFARGGFLLSMGFSFATGPSWAATESRLDFPPLKESSNAVPKTAESLRFPPLPFDSNGSTGSVPEREAEKTSTFVSGEDILSAVGQDRKSPSVSESLLCLTKEQAGSSKSASAVLKSATVAPKEQSALSALAAAVSELPPPETAAPPTTEENDGPSPRKKRPPRPTESVAPDSGVETDGKIVRVSVFIDVPFEEIKYPEGTAMLRTKNWLRKSFPGLPEQFSVNGRVVENGFDDDDRVYRYRTEYRLADITELLPKVEESDSKPVVEPVSESISKPVAKSVPKPILEPVSEQGADSASASVAGLVSESIAEPVAEPVSEPVAEPSPKPIVEPSPELGNETVTERTPVSESPASADVSITGTPTDSEPDTTTAQ